MGNFFRIKYINKNYLVQLTMNTDCVIYRSCNCNSSRSNCCSLVSSPSGAPCPPRQWHTTGSPTLTGRYLHQLITPHNSPGFPTRILSAARYPKSDTQQKHCRQICANFQGGPNQPRHHPLLHWSSTKRANFRRWSNKNTNTLISCYVNHLRSFNRCSD